MHIRGPLPPPANRRRAFLQVQKAAVEQAVNDFVMQVTPVYTQLENAYESKKYTVAVLEGGSRCFARGTKIRMFDGSLKSVEKIIIGDKIMNISGNGFNVVKDTHNGFDDMYTVKQARGIDYVVNSKHILALKQTRPHEKKVGINGFTSKQKRKHTRLPYDSDLIHDFDVEDFASKSKRTARCYTGFKQLDLELPAKDLLIDPYYLGLWLGDGTSSAPHEITTADVEIVDYMRDLAAGYATDLNFRTDITMRFRSSIPGTKISEKGKVYELIQEFKKLDLINNKHIPQQYIYGSLDDRLKILAGLIDSDGGLTGRNTISITQKNKKIIDGVLEILRISGFYTNGINEYTSKMKRADGSVYECQTYSIEFNHKDFKELNKYLKLPRKRIIKNCDRDYNSTSIKIEPAGFGEYFGFELENDPYFLLEDGTVAHNSSKTHSIIQFLIKYAQDNIGTEKRVLIARQKSTWTKATVLHDFLNVLKSYKIYNKNDYNKSTSIYRLHDCEFWFGGLDDDQKLHGFQSNIFWINEAVEATKDDFDQLEQRLLEFCILDYNPSVDEHWIYDSVCNRPDAIYIHSTMLQNPFIAEKSRNKILSYEPTEENYKNGTADKNKWEIYGLGLRSKIDGLIYTKFDYIDEIPMYVKAQARHRFGLDWGYSNDPTAAVDVYFYGNEIWIDEVLYETELSYSEIVRKLKAWMTREDVSPTLKGYADSSDPRGIKEVYKGGINIHEAKKPPGSILAGIMLLKDYRIHITKRSINFISEIKKYTWQKDKADKYINEPSEVDNHLMDALRYVAFMEFKKKSVNSTPERTKRKLGGIP